MSTFKDGVFYATEYSVYKPTQNGNGGVLTITFNQKGLLLKIAKQNPGAARSFDWQNATTFMIGMADIAQLVDAITTKGKVDLFHDSSKAAGSKSAFQKGLSVAFNQQYNSFFWSLRRTQEGQTTNAGCPTSVGEAMVIRELLLWAVPRLLEWDKIQIAGGEEFVQQANSQSQEYQGDGTSNLLSEMKKDPFWGVSETPEEPARAASSDAQPAQTQQTLASSPDPLARIIELAKSKFNAQNDDEAKMKAMEVTNMPLTPQHYANIIAELERR